MMVIFLMNFYTDGRAERYEYVKLGTFLMNTPQKRKVNLISTTAYDRMSLFDKDADVFWQGLTYPITLGAMLEQVCEFVGVARVTTTFINKQSDVCQRTDAGRRAYRPGYFGLDCANGLHVCPNDATVNWNWRGLAKKPFPFR